MTGYGSILAYVRDPRLTAHATSALPAWLWSADATRVLWANPTAAAIFDAPSPAAMAGATIDPRGTAALQIARLAGTLPHGAPPRLERLRGFGTRFRALMCACSRVSLADRTAAILVVAVEPAGPKLSLDERVRRLFDGCDDPIAVFAQDGTLLHATAAAQGPLHGLKSLAALGAEKLAGEALAAGRVRGGSHVGEVSVERIGADAATVLAITFARAAAEAKPVAPAATPVEAAAPLEPLETTVADIVELGQVQPNPQQESVTEPEPPKPPAHEEIPKETAKETATPERRQPLRFVWQMDADSRFTLSSDEFVELIGPRTAAALGRPWSEIAATLGLDADGQVTRAIASRDTWSGIVVGFPIDGSDERLATELSGLPVFDRDRSFRGYRGFGVCRDIARIAALAQMRRSGEPAPAPTAPSEPASATEPRPEPPAIRDDRPALSVVPKPENVVPFRASAPPAQGPTSVPSLTPVERTAFRELATRLTARLKNGDDQPEPPASPDVPAAEHPLSPPLERRLERAPLNDQRPILDRLPVGVLVYRLDNLIYANRAFLDWTGYDQLSALAEAGGLDALFVEPGSETLGKDGDKNGAKNGERSGAKSLTLATTRGDQMPVEARLFTTPWDGESALVLMLANATPTPDTANQTADDALRAAATEARELRSILDTASDGIIVLDRDGRMISVNRSAEVLFGYESRELSGLPFAGLFAPESQRVAFDAIDRFNRPGATSVPSEGREVIGRGRQGSMVPLFVTIGSIGEGSDKLAAIFRDVTPWKKTEDELVAAKRQAEKASSAKSDFLAKVSHEIRTPLNAIIGFSEVMMEERFGPVGNERYRQYLRDIHASGEHLVSLLNDLLDLSKIEAGKLELSFASVDLNELTQQCVALMQPQASRERVIVRTSLASNVPPVMADARSVRQIVLNLLSNSIKFTGTGGQVIVSSALGDSGEVVLRVRDTGVGMSEKEIAIALEPFRQLATSSRWGSHGTGLGLPLTKALAEANRATFSIKSAVNAGTLIEVAFPGARMAAE